MRRCLPVVLVVSMMMVSPSAASQDDLIEKINKLEQQIAELKALKEQQKFSAEKEDHCMKAVGREKFCKCLADGLPSNISFEQYIHILVTTKSKLGYESMTPTQKTSVDKTLQLREKCIEKGFFK